MSDYHILKTSKDADQAEVIFHFSIPNEDNYAGRNKRDVIKAFVESNIPEGETAVISQYPFISAPELSDIQNGIIFEHVEVVEFDANISKAAKRNIIDSRWTALNTEILNRLDIEFDFYGYDGTAT